MVCDGLGSAATAFDTPYGLRSHAYCAARIVSGTVSRFLSDNAASCFEDPLSAADRLKTLTISALSDFSREYGIGLGGFRMSGRPLRLLPTTLASFVCREEKDSADILCLWAGDSRCYCLDRSGLHQLTEDDTFDGKGRGLPRSDAPITNAVSLSEDFSIHSRRFRFGKPCFVFAASDGLYSSFASPIHFELALLPDGSTSLRERLRAAVSHQQDDCSLAGILISDQMTQIDCFIQRRKELSLLAEPLLSENETSAAGIPGTFSKPMAGLKCLPERLWQEYSGGYWRYLPPAEPIISKKRNLPPLPSAAGLTERLGLVGNWEPYDGYWYLRGRDGQEVFARPMGYSGYLDHIRRLEEIDLGSKPVPGLQTPSSVGYDRESGLVYETYSTKGNHHRYSNMFAADSYDKAALFQTLAGSVNELHMRGFSHGRLEEFSATVVSASFPVVRNFLFTAPVQTGFCCDVANAAYLMHLVLTGRKFDSLARLDRRIEIRSERGDVRSAHMLALIYGMISEPDGCDLGKISVYLGRILSAGRKRNEGRTQ